jgi:hypothetical protein
LAAAGDQNEDVIVGPTADHDGPQELADFDPLEPGAFITLFGSSVCTALKFRPDLVRARIAGVSTFTELA